MASTAFSPSTLTAANAPNNTVIKLHDAVLLGKAIGVVLYIGATHWASETTEIYVGLELSTAIPNGHSGTYDAHQYFVCRANHGIILPISNVVRVIKPIELLRKLSELKAVLAQQTQTQNALTVASPVNMQQLANRAVVSLNGILLDDESTAQNFKIQLKDNQDRIGTHVLTVPKQYIRFFDTANSDNNENNENKMEEDADDVKNAEELPIEPLVLKPSTKNTARRTSQSTKLAGSVRRSSISGRKYSINLRQSGMYDYWRKLTLNHCLAEPPMTYANKESAECEVSMQQCECLVRLSFMFEYYDEWIFRRINNFNLENDVDRMIDFVDNLEHYDAVQLLNDYYHCYDFHSPELRQQPLLKCTRMDCVCLMRHCRDVQHKNADYAQKKKLYLIDEDRSDDFDELYYQKNQHPNKLKGNAAQMELRHQKQKAKQAEISQEIVLQEILDRIHCFLCHDVMHVSLGSSAMKNWSNEELTKHVAAILRKCPEWQRVRNLRPKGTGKAQGDALFEKFSTRLTAAASAASEDDDNGMVKIGRNFVYEFINAKYSNLKHEILADDHQHGQQHRLDAFAWNDIYDLSAVITKSYKVRAMTNARRASVFSAKNLAAVDGDAVSIEFVICLLLYCNFYQLRTAFLATYRDNGGDDGDVEKRHSLFANMGRILKDNINTFGQEWNWNSTRTQCLYHCMVSDNTNQLSLKLLNREKLVFCGPISMTDSLWTAMLYETNFVHTNSVSLVGRNNQLDRFLFCMNGEYGEIDFNSKNEHGLLLKYNHLKYVDCSFVSAYEFDRELLFMNDANQTFYVANIVNILSGVNYMPFLLAFKLFQFVFMDNTQENERKYGLFFDNVKKQQLMDVRVQQTLVQLIKWNQKEVPAHILSCFDAICAKKMSVKLSSSNFVDLIDSLKLMFGDVQSMSISKICAICPNVTHINSDCIVLNDENVSILLPLLEMKSGSKLKQMHIVLNNNQSPNIQRVLSKYREMTHCHWKLNLDGNALKLNVID